MDILENDKIPESKKKIVCDSANTYATIIVNFQDQGYKFERADYPQKLCIGLKMTKDSESIYVYCKLTDFRATMACPFSNNRYQNLIEKMLNDVPGVIESLNVERPMADIIKK